MIPYGKHQAEDRYFQQNLTQDRVAGEVKEEREKRSTQRQDKLWERADII